METKYNALYGAIFSNQNGPHLEHLLKFDVIPFEPSQYGLCLGTIGRKCGADSIADIYLNIEAHSSGYRGHGKRRAFQFEFGNNLAWEQPYHKK